MVATTERTAYATGTYSETLAAVSVWHSQSRDVAEDPFGNIIRQPGPAADDNPFRFSTKYHDDEIYPASCGAGLVYYGYRYFDPELGRWLSRDSIEEQGGVNLYGFVGNCPSGFIDSLGMDRMNVYIEFIPKAELNMAMQPETAVYVSSTAEMVEAAKKQVGEKVDISGRCGNCVDTFVLSAHGVFGKSGLLTMGDSTLRPWVMDEYQEKRREYAGDEETWRLYRERNMRQTDEILRARAVLYEISRLMCKDSVFNVLVCGAGEGADGARLRRDLKAIFGPDTKVVTYGQKCGYYYGRPIAIFDWRVPIIDPLGVSKDTL